MELTISNFAKIKSASIKINGITVIAGNNNTGKSTVGKILCSVFNSMANIDTSLKDARVRNINRGLRNFLAHETDAYGFYSEMPIFPVLHNVLSRFSRQVVESGQKNDREKAVDSLIEGIQERGKIKVDDNLRNRISSIVNEALSISDKKLMDSIISLYFRRIFNERINNIDSLEKEAYIRLTIKEKHIDLHFKNDEISDENTGIAFTNSATYIDNPFILDRLNERYGMVRNSSYSLDADLYAKLRLNEDDDRIEDQALWQVLISEKLSEIMKLVDDVVPGKIVFNDKYMYENTNRKNALDVNSLSTGLKSFALLKQLLLNKKIKEKDVLVLDEPEIHLHPEWQLKYAELIVLMQKVFDLNVVITTHSSHFLEAIDVYAKIHKTNDLCNYYLAEMNTESNISEFKDMTNDIGKIYSNLVSPSLLIDKIKEEHGIADE